MLTEEDMRLLHSLLEKEAHRLIAAAPPPDSPFSEKQSHAHELIKVLNCAKALAMMP